MFYEEIIRKFNNAGIKYAIVGGVAVNLHGHIRMTADLNIVLELKDNNLAKAITTLRDSGFVCKVPVGPMGLADSNTRNDWIKNKNMKALNFSRDTEEVDLVVDTPVKYEEATKTNFSAKNINYPVVSKEDLIKMKEVSNRHHDIKKLKILIDIEQENK